jgi:hypothetical protein
MESMLECFLTVPRDQLPMFPMGMYAVYSVLGDSANAARLFRRLVRTLRIIYDRDQQDVLESLFYTAARRCGRFPCACAFTAPSREDCCVYCEESPERVAMTLSRCGACKKVVYCGAACQRAHWPMHKVQCKAWKSEAR